MPLRRTRRAWEAYAKQDPLWAIMTAPSARGGQWDLEQFMATGVDRVREVLKRIEDCGLVLPAGPALDFGCGVGRLTQALATVFPEVHGVDISPTMIQRARELNRFGERCRYHLNDAADLGLFETGTFAFVMTDIVLQHLPKPAVKRYLEEFGRILVPGGILHAQIPARLKAGERRLTRHGVPPRLRSVLLHARQTLTGKPGMEMNPMAPSEVLAVLQGAGLGPARQFEYHAGSWVSVDYVATREF